MKMIMDRDDLVKNSDGNYEHRYVIMRLDSLADGYKEAKFQLVKAHGGFGCSPTASGRAVYLTFLIDGEDTRFNRVDILGVASDEAVEEWYKMYGNEAVIKREEKGDK